MKVLRIYHSGVVGAWRQRETELRRAGWDTTLVAARRWNEGGADVHATGSAGFVAVRTWGRHPALFVYDPRPIARMLRADQYDVLDIHEEPFSLAAVELVVLRRLFARQTPIVMYTAQNILKRYPLPFRLFENWALRNVAAFYPCSQGAADVLTAKSVRGVVKVIPLGVELDRFSPSDFRRAPSPFVVGYVGRLLPAKGVELLIRATAGIDGVELRIVGEGPERANLEHAVKALGMAERVKFDGFVAPDDIADTYARFDALVVPSLPTPGWTEQFCRVAVEAMACGVPLIVSDAGALPEVVGEAGLAVPAGDATALGDAIRLLANDADRRLALRTRGIERSHLYTWQRVGQLHADLYAAAVAA